MADHCQKLRFGGVGFFGLVFGILNLQRLFFMQSNIAANTAEPEKITAVKKCFGANFPVPHFSIKF